MAWSWSHTAEAYDNARQNIENKDREWLEVCWAEWRAAEPKEYSEHEFNEKKYAKALVKAKKLPGDVLASDIWDKASEFATCDNGGFNAYCCPWGCHTVPFDLETSEARE